MRSESAKRTTEATRQKVREYGDKIAANRKPKFRPGDVVVSKLTSFQYLVHATYGNMLYLSRSNMVEITLDRFRFTLIHRPK